MMHATPALVVSAVIPSSQAASSTSTTTSGTSTNGSVKDSITVATIAATALDEQHQVIAHSLIHMLTVNGYLM
jgi:DNA-directed RNA polymerase specialized sigma54-like protein